jgi:hypothetical protein
VRFESDPAELIAAYRYIDRGTSRWNAFLFGMLGLTALLVWIVVSAVLSAST